MQHINDAMIEYYSNLSNNAYIKPPYIDIEQIGTDLVSLNDTSSVKTFTLPVHANRIVVYFNVKGVSSGGTIRLECSPINPFTNWATIVNTSFTSANNNSLVRVANSIGPYHFVRARVTSAITGGGHIDVYICALN